MGDHTPKTSASATVRALLAPLLNIIRESYAVELSSAAALGGGPFCGGRAAASR